MTQFLVQQKKPFQAVLRLKVSHARVNSRRCVQHRFLLCGKWNGGVAGGTHQHTWDSATFVRAVGQWFYQHPCQVSQAVEFPASRFFEPFSRNLALKNCNYLWCNCAKHIIPSAITWYWYLLPVWESTKEGLQRVCAAFVACCEQFRASFPEHFVKKELDTLHKQPLCCFVSTFMFFGNIALSKELEVPLEARRLRFTSTSIRLGSSCGLAACGSVSCCVQEASKRGGWIIWFLIEPLHHHDRILYSYMLWHPHTKHSEVDDMHAAQAEEYLAWKNKCLKSHFSG